MAKSHKLQKKNLPARSEAVNYLIKQAREREEYHNYVQMKIDRGVKSGFSTKTKDELLVEIKKQLNV